MSSNYYCPSCLSTQEFKPKEDKYECSKCSYSLYLKLSKYCKGCYGCIEPCPKPKPLKSKDK